MFRELFALRFGLSCETMILEACEWDEERSEEVLEEFTEFLSSCEDEGFTEKNKILEKLSDEISCNLNESEFNVLVEILNDLILNAKLLAPEGEQYDN